MPVATRTATVTAPSNLRLRRSDCSGPGIQRVKRGRGFSYVDADGRPVSDPEERLRIRELAIPPAWREVWICSDLAGHLQATGVDAADLRVLPAAVARHLLADAMFLTTPAPALLSFF